MRLIKTGLITMTITTIVIIAVSALGCDYGDRMNRAVQEFQKENPTARIVPVDEDGDGTTDFLGVDMDGDLRVDTDPAGKPIEVPNTRAISFEAETVDTGISELIALAAAVIGVPGVGLIGNWWGKRKPIKQLTHLVTTFAAARAENAPEGYMLVSKEIMGTLLAEKPGMLELIESIRAKQKEKEKAA